MADPGYTAWVLRMQNLEDRTRLPRFSHEEVSAWFGNFGLSFVDPNLFTDIVFDMRNNHEQLEALGLNERARQQSGIQAIQGILEDISRHPSHRHRQDARNILEEIEARERGDDESVLIGDPLPAPYLEADRRYPPYPRVLPREEQSAANIRLRLPRRQPDDDIPVPYLRIPPTNLGPPPADYPLNYQMGQWIPEDLVEADQMGIMIGAMLDGMGTLDPGLLPYKYMDDPAEDVLLMPEDCPFIVAPVAPHDQSLLNQRLWPALEIYDERGRGGTGPLQPTSYIYKLLSWCRMRMAQPNVARSYCMIFRANPRRYQEETNDEISEEPPPTTEELDAMIGFITKTMPTIFIYRGSEEYRYGGALGYHLRHSKPNNIYINGAMFDAIERMHRDGEDPSASIWIIYITFFHECGHYYFTVIYRPDPGQVAGTPRKMRYLVSHSDIDDENHPKHDPWYVRRGEMGEIIEWLIFGVSTSISLSAGVEPEQILYCLCWGSYYARGRDMIEYGPYVAARLIPAPVRMNNERLRFFIDQCKRQQAREMLQQEEAAEMVNIPPAGNGTAAGVIEFMDTEMAGGTWDDPIDVDMDMDMDMDMGVDRRTEFNDVDEDFTGYEIGRNKSYRRAIWRVKAEINDDVNLRSERRGDLERKMIPGMGYGMRPAEGRERMVYRRPDTAPLIPGALPDHIRPWALMLGVSSYTAVCVWVFMNYGPWYSEWIGGVPWALKMAHTFGTVVISFGIYIVPFRRLLKPLGMVRPASHGYFDWSTTNQNLYNMRPFADVDWGQRPRR